MSFLASLEMSTPIPPSTSGEPAPLTPASLVLSDTHQNLGAAYILSVPSRADLALEHLQQALELTPDDGEICFNLAAVLEALGEDVSWTVRMEWKVLISSYLSHRRRLW